MVIPFGPILKTGIEIVGPIILREVIKPRFRKFVESQVEGFAQELARRRFTTKRTKTKNVINIRRGKQRFQCRKVN